MRALLGLILLCGTAVAQPSPPGVTFTFANTDGTPLVDSLRVDFQCLGKDGRREVLELKGGRLVRDLAWIAYRVPDRLCKESRVLVTRGKDTLRLELPADRSLLDRAARRWDRDTPEVLRFKPGTFGFLELTIDAATATIAKAARAQAEADYQKQLAEAARARPTPPPAPPPPPPKQPTDDEIRAMIAKRGGLQKIVVESAKYKVADKIAVRLTGVVMLTGGCQSNQPMFGLEQKIGAAWQERIAVPTLQLDCGAPEARWTDHRVEIELARHVAVLPAGKNKLTPGTYRLVFQGADTKPMVSAPFQLD
jgi:hypothetical protein